MYTYRFRLLSILLIAIIMGAVVLLIDQNTHAQGDLGTLFLPSIQINQPASAEELFAAAGKPAELTYAGKTSGEWSAQWWQWVESEQTAGRDPFSAEGDTDCSTGQSGPVWFLAGNTGGASQRHCTKSIPGGKAIFYPLVNFVFFNGENEDYTLQEKRETLDGILSDTEAGVLNSRACLLSSTIDGVSATLLPAAIVRTQSDPFAFAGDPEAISDGYWVMLHLPKGEHVVTIQGGYCDLDTGDPLFYVDVTYALKGK